MASVGGASSPLVAMVPVGWHKQPIGGNSTCCWCVAPNGGGGTLAKGQIPCPSGITFHILCSICLSAGKVVSPVAWVRLGWSLGSAGMVAKRCWCVSGHNAAGQGQLYSCFRYLRLSSEGLRKHSQILPPKQGWFDGDQISWCLQTLESMGGSALWSPYISCTWMRCTSPYTYNTWGII